MTGEFDLISKYFKPLAGPEGLDLSDDASCVRGSSNHDLIVTKDILVEHVHFRNEDPADLLAHKALAVNVSDCVAKGAQPNLYWLGLALPASIDDAWMEGFSKGLNGAQTLYGCHLAGGDTCITDGPMVISVTLLGAIPTGKMVTRSGAKCGDDIYVTGTLGDAALGLWCLEKQTGGMKTLVSAYQKPMPPFKFGIALSSISNSSADISDGLIADATHISQASNVGMLIHKDDLPLSKQGGQLLRREPDLWSKVWSGGDDYQIVFTASKGERVNVLDLAMKTGTQVTIIGEVISEQGVQLLDKGGQLVQVTHGGYTHF